MSKFEGTKGKWEFVETNQHPTEENEYHSVVQMPKIAISITNTKFLSKKETKANAKLIAAAPDLLEALQNANNVLKMASLIDKTNTCSEAQIICENAIKKATE